MTPPYHPWQPGGERTILGDLTFDSTLHCGNGHDFRPVGDNHIRFRARVGHENYAWRFHFRLDSSGDGREIVLEVADLNHFGQELWQEQATVISTEMPSSVNTSTAPCMMGASFWEPININTCSGVMTTPLLLCLSGSACPRSVS